MAIMVLLLAILLPAPAHAQFFVEASGGKQMNQDADLALTQPTLSTNVRFKSVEWDDESFTPPPYYGYGFGYFLESAPWFGIRAEFRHQKVIARTNQSYPATGMLDGQTVDRNIQLDEIVQDLEVTHGLNTISVAFIGRRGFNETSEFPRGKTQVYGGLGTGVIMSHTDSTVRESTFPSRYRIASTPLFEAFAGARFHATRKLYGLVENKMTRIHVDAPVVDGRVNVVFRTHQFALGLGLSFP